jgi:hypothetical protein
MVPYDHSRLHARDFGGIPEDYLQLDNFLDATKLHCADSRHRAILHSTFGMYVAEQVFGPVIVNSEGCEIPTRELARRHVMQDCNCVPTVKEWLDAISAGTATQFDRPQRAELQWLKENVYTPKPAPWAEQMPAATH